MKAYEDYTIHKFTYSELKEKYKRDPKTIRRHFDSLDLAELKSDLECLEEVNLVFDASYFKREFCLFLFRSNKTNIHYDFKDSEKIIYYEEALKGISQKYRILSFTIDGRRGVIKLLESLFPSFPIAFGKECVEIHDQETKDRMWNRVEETNIRTQKLIGREFHEEICRLEKETQKL